MKAYKMKNIAILVTHEHFDTGSQNEYAPMVQGQFNQLAMAFDELGAKLHPGYWEDTGIDWAQFDIISPLMAWNYPQNLARFLSCLDEIKAANVRLANPQEIIRDNFDKSYLHRLFENGAAVPPTLNIDINDEASIYGAFEDFNCDEIIIKPRVGGGAWRQARLKRGEKLPTKDLLPPDFALIQPFIPSVCSQGELSMLFMGNEFSHALMKTPKSGDYRSQTKFGAREINIEPPKEAIWAAQEILETYDPQNTLSYARVDMVEGENGNWLLMEIELIEPYLYLPFDGQNGEHGAKNFARAIAAKL